VYGSEPSFEDFVDPSDEATVTTSVSVSLAPSSSSTMSSIS
jgi:hypothetical protein